MYGRGAAIQPGYHTGLVALIVPDMWTCNVVLVQALLINSIDGRVCFAIIRAYYLTRVNTYCTGLVVGLVMLLCRV